MLSCSRNIMSLSRPRVQVWKIIVIYLLVIANSVVSMSPETRQNLLDDVTKIEKQIQHQQNGGVTTRNTSPEQSDNVGNFGIAHDSDNVNNLEKKWNKGVRVWGKRNQGEDKNIDAENRKWDTNGVRIAGGKQSKDNGKTVKSIVNTENTNVATEKKWNRNGVKVWGKRSGEDVNVIHKKWNKNSVRIWGKRDSLDVENMATELEKKWNRNGVKVWGKRDPVTKENEAVNIDKKWNRNGVKVWGKRTQEHDNEKASTEDDENTNKNLFNQNNLDLEKPGQLINGVHSNKGLVLNKKWNRNGVRVWGKRAEEKAGERNNKETDNELRKFINMDEVLDQSDIKSSQTTSLDKSSLQSDSVINNEPASSVDNNNDNNNNNNNNNKISENNRFENTKRKWDNNKVRIWGKRNEESRSSKVVAGNRYHKQNSLFTNRPDSFPETRIDAIPSKHTTLNDDDEDLMTSPEFTSGLTKTLQRTTLADSSSSKQHRHKRSWREDVGWIAKRGRSVRSNYNQPPEGPKRGWRTNVIRVWGKRSG